MDLIQILSEECVQKAVWHTYIFVRLLYGTFQAIGSLHRGKLFD